MGIYNIDFDVLGVFGGTNPDLSVVYGGVVIGTVSVTGSSTNPTFQIDTGSQTFDSTLLSFMFNSNTGLAGDLIQLSNIQINGSSVPSSNFSTDTGASLNGGVLSLYQAAYTEYDAAAILADTQIHNGNAPTTTVAGTTGDDRLYGTTGDDVFQGDDGVDRIYAYEGNDYVDAGAGNDIVYAEAGNDVVYGGDGVDRLYGAAGNDYVNGGAGNDFVYGQEGNDILHGGDGVDRIYGNEGVDVIYGGNDDDIAYGNDDDDELHGGLGSDRLYGNLGNDVIYGDEGNDRIYGNEGDDILFGGDGVDRIYGNDGNDQIHGGEGNDLLYGLAGSDHIYGNNGDDRLYGNEEDDVIEGGSGSDRLYGGTGNDSLDGGDDNDYIYGNEGNDNIIGGAGIDRLYGNDGDDVIDGGDDNDIIYGSEGTDTLIGGGGSDRLYGGTGNDTVNGGDDNDIIYGHEGIDNLNGDDGDDRLYGGDDNDTVSGGLGDDIVDGDDGNDILYGGGGNDIINGGLGDDILYASAAMDSPDNIQDILDANPNLFYSADTGNFYQYITTTSNWSTANSNAQSSTLEGFNGYLATITSAQEQAFIEGIVDGYAWIGGGDTNTEGTFEWLDGPESGQAVSYTNWYSGSPTSNSGTNDHILLLNDNNSQQWYAYTENYNAGHVIEWTGADVITLNPDYVDTSADINSLRGGDGADTLYGAGGDDLLDGGAGNDVIDGGDGSDTIRFKSVENAVTVNLADGTSSGDGDDTFTNVENAEGTDYNDTLIGDGGDNILQGHGGNDVIMGGSGDDEIHGGDGDDIIYATNDGVTITPADILSEYSFLSYNAATGNFYQYVETTANWNTANNNAQSSVVNGVNGHLVTITSQGEQDYIDGFVTGFTWIGGGDANTEGSFEWLVGPESGDAISYTNWYQGSPISNSGTNDHILLLGDSYDNEWYTYTGNYNAGYVIEWEGADIIANGGVFGDGTKEIYGGDGLDTLYGGGGLDTFVFEAANAFHDVDIINDFSTSDLDAFDISDLLSGYTDGVSDINDFVQFVQSGSNTLLQIDANGTDGGAGFQSIAQINGVTGLDADTLYAAGEIIT